MGGSLWRHVVQELRTDHRCLVPTLPLGGHRSPMRADADLSPRGIGRLQAEFLERLDVLDVTLVGNDAALFQFAAGLHPEPIPRLIVPPSYPFNTSPPPFPAPPFSFPPPPP